MNSLFRRMPFGYSVIEVEAFVSELQKAIEAEKAEVESLKEKIEQQNAELEKFREQERFISGAILNAQNQAVEIEQKAQEKYDQTIFRLNEESKLWESKIIKNKERLVALDDMIQDFLTNIKSEMELALTPTLERRTIDSTSTATEQEDMDPGQDVPQTEQTDGPLENPPEPMLNGDVQQLYWKLKNIEYGSSSEEGKATKKAGDDPADKKDVYIPSEAERNKLSELCRELGIL